MRTLRQSSLPCWSCTATTGKAVNAVVKDLSYAYNAMQVNSKFISNPNTLVLDAGTVDTSTATGLVTKTISQSLTFGHSYYLCYRPEGSGAIASIQDAENPINNFIGKVAGKK